MRLNGNMQINDKFVLIKDVDNILYLNKSEIEKRKVKNGNVIVKNTILMLEHSINHFSYNYISKILKNINLFCVVYLPSYPLNYSFNKKTNQLLINLFPFGVETVSPTKPNPLNIYACLAGSLILKNAVTKRINVKSSFASPIINFLTSMFLRLFGRRYGLIGRYSHQIIKMKFLIGVYIYISFFGLSFNTAKRLSLSFAPFDYNEDKDIIQRYNFKKFDDLLDCLSEIQVMPGMNKYLFLRSIYKYFPNVNIFPMFEDLARFVSIFLASNIPGSNMITKRISEYNEEEYNIILEISKIILKAK